MAALLLKQSISINRNASYLIMVLVNDVEYGGELMLYFNVTIKPVAIRLPNVTYQFTVNSNANRYAQVKCFFTNSVLCKYIALRFALVFKHEMFNYKPRNCCIASFIPSQSLLWVKGLKSEIDRLLGATCQPHLGRGFIWLPMSHSKIFINHGIIATQP